MHFYTDPIVVFTTLRAIWHSSWIRRKQKAKVYSVEGLNCDWAPAISSLALFNKTRNVRITSQWHAFAQLFLRWKNKCYIFWVCVCSLRYPAYNARAPYYHLWPDRPCNICLRIRNKTHDFLLKNVEYNEFFDLLCNFYLKQFSFEEELNEIWENVCIGSHVWDRYSCQILMRLELSRQIFKNYSNTKYD
jgi:hypothetical protein